MIPRFFTNILSWRNISILAIIAFVLQIINSILSWHIKQQEKSPFIFHDDYRSRRNSINARSSGLKQHNYHLGLKISNDHEAILTHIARWSVLDSSGEFRVANRVLQPQSRQEIPPEDEEALGSTARITLVTQCSLSQLHYLPNLTDRWQGPISVAVFSLSNEVQAAVQMFLQLQRCYPSVKDNVTFSLVFPLNSPTSPHIVPTKDSTPCDQIFTGPSRSNYEFQDVQYPNNLLRNVAHKSAMTDFMMVLDIDMVPSAGLHNAFINYAKKGNLLSADSGNDKTVWVVPAYEVKSNSEVPLHKTQLLMLKEMGSARPFYHELCWKCQRHTDYPSWEKSINPNKENDLNPQLKESYSRNRLQPLYEVLWKDPWEPFYICRNNVPPYDERFRQYGFNRISQVCELHVAGYKFVVIDEAFVVHRGFKTAQGFHPNKDVEQEKNRMIFRQFKIDLKNKYPESSRRCY